MSKWITDMGTGTTWHVEEDPSKSIYIARYGVWEKSTNNKASVVEVSDDLPYLQSKYGPELKVYGMEAKK